MEADAVEAPKEPTLLDRIRNTWEFANLSQWIFTFGKAVKIDETWSDIEVCMLWTMIKMTASRFCSLADSQKGS